MTGNFVDYVKIFCASGHGGAGSMSLRREKFIPKGGPDGGDGGKGGSIIIKGNKQLWTLLHLKYTKHLRAEKGKPGGGARLTGAHGEDLLIEVPMGTIVRDAQTGQPMAEIIEDQQEQVLMPGGKGGLGNWHFRSSTNQTPRYAQPGLPGQEAWCIFELKVLADVGLVGFPNAGKSTLLATLTAAKPKIADYAFTTLTPNLGIVAYRDGRSFVMADIPGIIEGASEGKGLGYRFLRHIERNAALLFLISADDVDHAASYLTILNELEKYNPELLHKRRMIAISKSDMLDNELKDAIVKNLPKDVPHVFVSSILQEGLLELKDRLWKLINN